MMIPLKNLIFVDVTCFKMLIAPNGLIYWLKKPVDPFIDSPTTNLLQIKDLRIPTLNDISEEFVFTWDQFFSLEHFLIRVMKTRNYIQVQYNLCLFKEILCVNEKSSPQQIITTVNFINDILFIYSKEHLMTIKEFIDIHFKIISFFYPSYFTFELKSLQQLCLPVVKTTEYRFVPPGIARIINESRTEILTLFDRRFMLTSPAH
jgi:hypothetical protein